LAYQIERHWDKDKILTEYLNSIYFGEGAYGIEAAARTYFGWAHPGCGQAGHEMCAKDLTPPEAAMLAGIITSPSAFSPRINPQEIAQSTLSGVAPTASVVVLDNETGAVKAMVGGNDYQNHPFNLATNGHRQPGSAFKPFTLATALSQGISPGTSYASNEKV